jgi:hypothetical protein
MKLSKFRFILKPEQELILPPYKGSTFRGGFGHAFRRAVCMENNDACVNCTTRFNCVYTYVFDTSILQEIERGERFPHPFIIEPPLETKQYYRIDDRIDFNLILVGRAIDYFPYFIVAFEEMGRTGIGKNRGRFSVEKVISVYEGKEIAVYDGDSHFKDDYPVIESFKLVYEAAKLNYHRLTLHFLTPSRIKYNGKLTINITFDNAKNNVRTIHSDLVWHDWERYSQRQNTRMKMGGFIGKITFEGELCEFMPFIKLGEYLHIGKETVFGLGKYEFIGE